MKKGEATEPMSDDTVTVLRTGKLFVFDMAVDTLKRAKVPHFTHEESSSGLRVALPAAPSGGPGVWWVIRVREDFSDEAKRLLSALPFPTGTNPDVWDYDASGKPLPKWAQVSFVGILIAAAAWLIYSSIIVPLL